MSRDSAEDYAYNEGDSPLPPSVKEEKIETEYQRGPVAFDQFTESEDALAGRILSGAGSRESVPSAPTQVVSDEARRALEALLAEGDKRFEK